MGVEYLLALVFWDPHGEYVSGALGRAQGSHASARDLCCKSMEF